jgi:hypothetical protein
MRNQSSKPKPVQTDWQQKKELQQPPNKSEFQTLTKLLQTLQPSKKNIMQSSSVLRTQAKTHTQKKKNLTTEQNFAAKFILEINSNTTTTTMSAFKLFSLRNKTKQTLV